MARDAPASVHRPDPRADTGTDRPDETGAERDDRNLMELLQELRVAGLGVQVLFGFMLSLPFITRFVELSHPQRDLYVATLLLAAISTALLMAPSPTTGWYSAATRKRCWSRTPTSWRSAAWPPWAWPSRLLCCWWSATWTGDCRW
jgi:Family of unknown function (DUF6328)